MTAAREPVEGGYITLPLSIGAVRVYFEEAGGGIPLLCLHTAGADSRQYRHVMNDPEVTARFRVVAFDMPWHGKSTPPEGWWRWDYSLSHALYVETILAVIAALDLDRPAVMGCSMGGRVVLFLAARHADKVRAVIGLESTDRPAAWYDRAWLHHPEVHGGEVCAAQVSGNMAPHSPEPYRQETLWAYMQSGPGVFKGDLDYFFRESDYGEITPEIDASRCGVYLLTGEYDYSCTAEATRETAARIPGARAVVMCDLGHFPMSENPAHFRRYLLPVLADIERRFGSAAGAAPTGERP